VGAKNLAVVLTTGDVFVTAVCKVVIFPTDVTKAGVEVVNALDVVTAAGVDIVVSYVIVTGTGTLGVVVSVVMI
jgi:hypothetical protein